MRYMLFTLEDADRYGGLDDLVGVYNDLTECQSVALEKSANTYFLKAIQILDIKTGIVTITEFKPKKVYNKTLNEMIETNRLDGK